MGERWPLILPGGKAALVSPFRSPRDEGRDVAVVSLTTGESKVVVKGASYPRYVDGIIFYARGGSILASAFDVGRLAVTGPEVTVLDDVKMYPRLNGYAFFEVGSNGVAVFVPGFQRAVERTLVWFDRAGRMQPISAAPRPYLNPALSPDGRRIAVCVEGPSRDDIWIGDLASDAWTPLTLEGDNRHPVWSPDGARVAFQSVREAATMSQPMTPPALDRVVRTCLAKDPDERWQSAHDVMAELKWIGEGGSQAAGGLPSPPRPPRGRRCSSSGRWTPARLRHWRARIRRRTPSGSVGETREARDGPARSRQKLRRRGGASGRAREPRPERQWCSSKPANKCGPGEVAQRSLVTRESAIPFRRLSCQGIPCSRVRTNYGARAMEKKTWRARGRRKSPSLLERVNRNAAGIDCGSAEHYVAVPPDRDPMNVRRFRTFTTDLSGLGGREGRGPGAIQDLGLRQDFKPAT